MSNFMRRHRRLILVLVIAFVGVPFVFWGGGFGGIRSNDGANGNVPGVVAQVGSLTISSQAFLRQFDAISQSRSAGGIEPTALELFADGTVDRILELLENDALLVMEISERDLLTDRAYLVEQLKLDPFFQDDSGGFDSRLWNQWVERSEGADWNSVYGQVRDQIQRRIFIELIAASARVLDDDVRREFEDLNTKIKVKYAAIEPPIDLTEEELRAHYDDNLDDFRTTAQRKAEFIAVSLEPPEPPEVQEVIDRGREGEDFAELAKLFSAGPKKDQGGDIGWVVYRENLPAHQKPLFELQTGEVSDAVKGPTGTYVYKITEERTSELSGERDVRVRQIVFRPSLEAEERSALKDFAESISKEAVEAGELGAVAEREDLKILTTDMFTAESLTIENVDSFDALLFRRGLSELPLGTVSGVVQGRNNLFVAKIVEFAAPEQRSFEDALGDVETAAVAAYKLTPAYESEAHKAMNDVVAKAAALNEAADAFPDLGVTVKESPEFTSADFLFSSGIMWNCAQAYASVGRKEIGALGTLKDFRQIHYVIELVDRIPPEDSVWEEKWPEENERLREVALRTQSLERQQDYLQILRERALANALIMEDYNAISQVLGLDDLSDSSSASVPAPSLPASGGS